MDNKRIAVLTGVFYYLRDEELKRQSMIMHAEPGGQANSWALYGRQLIMRRRGLVQRRILTGGCACLLKQLPVTEVVIQFQNCIC